MAEPAATRKGSARRAGSGWLRRRFPGRGVRAAYHPRPSPAQPPSAAIRWRPPTGTRPPATPPTRFASRACLLQHPALAVHALVVFTELAGADRPPPRLVGAIPLDGAAD